MKILKQLFFILFLFCPILFYGAPVWSSDNQSSSQGVTVLPAKFELYATRGEALNQSLKIVNDDDHDYLYAISLDNISITGENGEVLIGGASPNLSNLLSSWVEFDQPSGVLEAKKTKIINFSIDIPKETEFGGKYASIVISMDKIIREAGEKSGTAKIVSLILVSIAGGYEDNAKILSFDLERNGKNYNLLTRIRNQGISHVKPSGNIIISDIFGRTVAKIPFSGDNVLPGSTRKTTTSWQPETNLFGYYTATLTAKYGQTNNSDLSSSFSFYDFSNKSWLYFLLTLALMIIGFIVYIINRKFRKQQN